MVYLLVVYTLFDVAWDIWRSRRKQRDNRAERSKYALLYLLHQLDIKSAEAPLERMWQRRMRDVNEYP